MEIGDVRMRMSPFAVSMLVNMATLDSFDLRTMVVIVMSVSVGVIVFVHHLVMTMVVDMI